MDVKEITRALAPTLPMVFARTAVPRLMPGVISAGHLANLNSQKRGPDYVRVGKQVLYEKESFLQWLEGYLMERAVPEYSQNIEVANV